MLITRHDPDATAGCPECGVVKCLNTGGNLAFAPRYMDFHHEKCGTKWRQYIDESRSEILTKGNPHE